MPTPRQRPAPRARGVALALLLAAAGAAAGCAGPEWGEPLPPARRLAIHLQSFDERARVGDAAEADLALRRAAGVARGMDDPAALLGTAQRAAVFYATPTRRREGIELLGALREAPAARADAYTRGYLAWALGSLCAPGGCGDAAVGYGRRAATLLGADPAPPAADLPSPRRLHVYALADLAVALERAGRRDEALAAARRAADLGARRLPPDDPGLARSRAALARLHAESGDAALAVALYRDVLPILREAGTTPAWALLGHQATYAAAALRVGATREGMDAADRAFFLVEPAARGDAEATRLELRRAIGMLREVGAWQAVEELAAAELDIHRTAARPAPPHAVARATRDLAEAHWKLGLPDEADRGYRSILRALAGQRDPAARQELARTLASYGAFLADQGRAEEAARMRQRAEAVAARAGAGGTRH